MIYKLEDRVLFDAALPVDVAEMVAEETPEVAEETPEQSTTVFDQENQTPQGDETAPTDTPDVLSEELQDLVTYTADNSNELYLIDTTVADYNTLIDQIPDGAHVEVISPNENDLGSISSLLDNYESLDSIHILSHGSDAEITLGSTTLKSDNLSLYSDIFKSMGESLNADGDILLYGCNVAEFENGEAFIEQIAHLTGADIAASNDTTGINGDWNLEFHFGSVETASLNLTEYGHDMTTPVITNAEDGVFINEESVTINGESFDAGSKIYLSADNILDGSDIEQTSSYVSALEMNFTVDRGTIDEGNMFLFVEHSDGGVSAATRVKVGHMWTPDLLDTTAWYDATDLDGDGTDEGTDEAGQDGGVVTTWADKSGNGFDISQDTAEYKPTTGGTLNGHNVLDFDQDYLFTGDGLGADINSIFIVAASDSTITDSSSAKTISSSYGDGIQSSITLGSSTGALSNEVIAILDEDNPGGYSDRQGISSGNLASIDTNGHVYSAVLGDNWFMGFDGSDDLRDGTSGARHSLNYSDSFTVGAQTQNGNLEQRFNGSIAEVIAIDSAVDPETRAKIEGYLAWKWGLELDSNHIYKEGGPVVCEAPSITDAGDEVYFNGETVTVIGQSFAAGVTNVYLSADNTLDAGDILQTSSVINSSTITFEVDRGSINEGDIYLFVSNSNDFASLSNPDYKLVKVGRQWTPEMLDTTAWYDATDLDGDGTDEGTGEAGQDGGVVTTWADKSGNGFDISQDTAEYKPTTGGTLNGHNVLDFDQDYLFTGDGLGADINSIFIVAASDSTITDSSSAKTITSSYGDGIQSSITLGSSTGALNNEVIAILDEDNPGSYSDRQGISSGNLASIDTNGHVYSAVLGDNWFMGFDGSDDLRDGTSGARHSLNYSDSFTVGAQTQNGNLEQRFNGSIAEVIAIDSAVDAETRAKIEGYLAWKWGLEDNLDQNHNYIQGDVVLIAPELSTTSAISYTEGTGVTALDNSLVLTDYDDTNLVGASVEVTGSWDGAIEELSYTLTGGITLDASSTSSKLVFTGSASVSDYQSVLRSVSYENTSDTPSETNRTVNWIVSDSLAQNVYNSTIAVTAVNDTPTATGVPGDVTVEEDVATGIDLSAITLADVDTGNSDITLKLSAGGATLSASDSGGVAVDGSGSGALTLTGTVTEINTYLDTVSNVKYVNNTAHTFGDDADTITVEVNDNGNSGSGGGADVALGTVNVDITAVNDAPTLTAFSSAIDSVDEDTQVELTFDEINAQGDEADVDGTITGYKITSVSTGTLKIGADSASATVWVAGTNDTVNATDNIYWTGAANENGTINAFTAKAIDNNAALSSTAIQATVTVNPTNDAPIADGTVTIPGYTDSDTIAIDASTAFTELDGEDLKYSSDDLAAGLTLDPNTGLISGTAEAGTYTMTIKAIDVDGTGTPIAHSTEAEYTLILTIEDTPIEDIPPVISDTPAEAPASPDPIVTPTAAETPVEANPEHSLIVKETLIDTDIELYTGQQKSTDRAMVEVVQQVREALSATTPAPEINVAVTDPSFHSRTAIDSHSGLIPAPQPQPLTMEEFNELDIDSSNSLNMDEFNQHYKGVDFNKFDLNDDGIIDEDEFKKMIQQVEKDGNKENSFSQLMGNSTHILNSVPQYATAFQSPLQKAIACLAVV